MIRYPRRFAPGQVRGAKALNIDLAPTLLELAGVPTPSEMQGSSWVPLLTDASSVLREDVFYEYFKEDGYSTPTLTAIRTHTHKLVTYPGKPAWTELFDLRDDPTERTNLAKLPSQQALRNELAAALQAAKDRFGYRVPPYAD